MGDYYDLLLQKSDSYHEKEWCTLLTLYTSPSCTSCRKARDHLNPCSVFGILWNVSRWFLLFRLLSFVKSLLIQNCSMVLKKYYVQQMESDVLATTHEPFCRKYNLEKYIMHYILLQVVLPAERLVRGCKNIRFHLLNVIFFQNHWTVLN